MKIARVRCGGNFALRGIWSPIGIITKNHIRFFPLAEKERMKNIRDCGKKLQGPMGSISHRKNTTS